MIYESYGCYLRSRRMWRKAFGVNNGKYWFTFENIESMEGIAL